MKGQSTEQARAARIAQNIEEAWSQAQWIYQATGGAGDVSKLLREVRRHGAEKHGRRR